MSTGGRGSYFLCTRVTVRISTQTAILTRPLLLYGSYPYCSRSATVMDRRPEAAPAQDAQGLLPIICWASDSVLAAVGGYLAGEAGQNDGNDNQERVAGEAEDNGSQGAAAGGLAGGNQDAPEVSGNDGAGVEPDAVVAIGGRENGQIAAGALEEGQGVGEEGQESGEVVVAIENGAGHAGASGAARDKEAYGREGRREAVVHQNATDGRIAGAAGEIVVDEHEEEAVAVVRAELRWPVMDNVLEAVRRRPLRALLLTSVFSGALFVPLTLWGISRDLMNVGQGQVALLRFGGGGAMGAINNFRCNYEAIQYFEVVAWVGVWSLYLPFGVKPVVFAGQGCKRYTECTCAPQHVCGVVELLKMSLFAEVDYFTPHR